MPLSTPAAAESLIYKLNLFLRPAALDGDYSAVSDVWLGMDTLRSSLWRRPSASESLRLALSPVR